MAEHESRISFSKDGALEIVGSEEFVSKQVERFEDLIKQLFASPPSPPPQPRFMDRDVTPPNPNGKAAPADQGAGLVDYPNLFAVHDDKIQITRGLPGKTPAEKMVAAAELYALASSLNGTEVVPFGAIRTVCKEHGCLDESNFSTIMKAEKELFTFGGKKGSRNQTLKLTQPGKKAAQLLARQLNDIG
jgi:hypothetical protein